MQDLQLCPRYVIYLNKVALFVYQSNLFVYQSTYVPAYPLQHRRLCPFCRQFEQRTVLTFLVNLEFAASWAILWTLRPRTTTSSLVIIGRSKVLYKAA
jgi:hypothetical protein